MFHHCIFLFYIITSSIVYASEADLYCLRPDSNNPLKTVLGICNLSKKVNRTLSSALFGSNSTALRNRLTYNLICLADSNECEGVTKTLDLATDIISSVLNLETPLQINASYLSFCNEFDSCHSDYDMISIGQAYPSVSYLMVDSSDNMTRMYPQALLKQHTEISPKPVWGEYDITAQFNSEIDWYFVNDPTDIDDSQTDFLINAIHELIHGLGFMTSWTDDLYYYFMPYIDNIDKFITPHLLGSAVDELFEDGQDIEPFWGFVEFPFDKLIHYRLADDDTSAGKLYPFTSISKRLNKFSNDNTMFNNPTDMAHSWYASDEFIHASHIYEISITEFSVVAVVDNESILYLESSITPFLTGSSLCHVDQSEYINSDEYLMTYLLNQGIDLQQLEIQYPEGPIGPKLLKIMAAIGYKIDKELNKSLNANTTRPSLSYWTPSVGVSSIEIDAIPSYTVNHNNHTPSPTQTSSLASHQLSYTHDLIVCLISCIYISTLSVLFY